MNWGSISGSPGQLNWPVSVDTDGTRVLVADAYNHRLLIWNSFPTSNGQSASFEIRLPEIRWPWGVWTDGTRLVATGTQGPFILIWNTFPTQTNQSFNVKLGSAVGIGTPRTITSDGTRLIVGDHNPSSAFSPM
jgi:hypothetical protein